ncbi:MAG: hypothetical protein R3A10_08175 [Caldilineaceae bacterium]
MDIFEEYDTRLEGLDADVLVSLHADSCIDATGFKVAYHVDTSTLLDDQRLQQCIRTAVRGGHRPVPASQHRDPRHDRLSRLQPHRD